MKPYRLIALALWAFALSACLVLRYGPNVEASSEPPKPKAPVSLGVFVAGDTAAGAWVYKAPLLAADTAWAVWKQKKAGATTWTQVRKVPTRGTTDVAVIAQDGMADSIQLCVQVTRPTTSPSPNVCAKKARAASPPAGADSVTIALASVRTVLVNPYQPPACPAGWSCAWSPAPVPAGARYTYSRGTAGLVDSLRPGPGFKCQAPSQPGPGGVAFTGCQSWQDGAKLALRTCVAAIRADGQVTWVANSAASCASGEPAQLMAARFGPAWHPELPPADSVAFQVTPVAGGFAILVTQPSSGLSLTLAQL